MSNLTSAAGTAQALVEAPPAVLGLIVGLAAIALAAFAIWAVVSANNRK